ncbi:hypothetical protein [Streptomyces varsoviensis]|uniref:Extradiol ring-cleavage dioxygenase LigAB LigA subunit domain-containing protein n=1 Tax=Streptomyces varsoviensis TaxID=67373 RepID=A0ABR5J4K0_9ACTN|nr:hypothetical protein [Streptomyces varsoviensis]KOG88061.1 hypothetical protein ADK38_21895 [Streptomyces varsoviensis]
MASSPGASDIRGLRAAYTVNRLCHRLHRDPDLVRRLREGPERALADWPLTAEDRRLLLTGDIAALYGRGAHPVLLVRIAALSLFGVTADDYSRRIRTAGRRGGAPRAPTDA